MAYSRKKAHRIKDYYNNYGLEATVQYFQIKHESVKRAIRMVDNLPINRFDLKRIDENEDIYLELESYEIKTVDELLEYSKIDTDIWEPSKVVTNVWGSKDWPCKQIKVWLKRKVKPEIDLDETLKFIYNEIEKYSPPKVNIIHKKHKDAYMWEIGLVDHHIGQLSCDKEVGENYDVGIAQKLAHDAIDFLIDKVNNYSVDKILYHMGQDFYNVNSQLNQTVSGTPQDEDGRWQRSFDKGVRTQIEIIDKLHLIAPVDVVCIPGNHDEERIHYAAAVVKAWFRNYKNVEIDNRPISRKYYKYGANLLGFTHAEKTPLDRLIGIMPIEAKEWWSQCENYEWHTGHLHTKFIHKTLEDKNGITVRRLPALVPVDAWHFNKGYLHNRETNSFLWHKEYGNQVQINYKI